MSAFLRARVLDAKPAKARRRVIKRHPVSSLLYDATDEGGPIVTHEQIRAALAETRGRMGGGRMGSGTCFI